MLRAELLKLRSMPTPRVTTAVVLGLMVLASVIVAIVAPGGDNAEWYYRAPELAASIGGTIGALVLGAWVVGVEFSSRTMRLAATVQPARTTLLAIKLATAVIVLVLWSVLVLGATMGLQALMSGIGGVTFPSGEAFDTALGSAVVSVLWGLFAFGLVLALKNYTAGLIAATVLVLGVDNILQLIPKVGDYTFGAATNSILNSFTGEKMDLGITAAILASAAWIVGVGLLGTLRFTARDLK